MKKKIKTYRGVAVKKYFGQHFLTDNDILSEIGGLITKNNPEQIIEIGGGNGELTQFIIEPSRKISVIEIDSSLVRRLSKKYVNYDNIDIIEADARKINFDKYLNTYQNNVICGNLPYLYAVNILKKLLPVKSKIAKIVVMLQLEVARKITASVNNKHYSSLSLFFNYNFETKMSVKVSRNAFYPPPKVDSAVLIMKPKSEDTDRTPEEEKLFFKIIHSVFLARRKKIMNSFKQSQFLGFEKELIEKSLETAQIELDKRPDQIDLEQYSILAKLLSNIEEEKKT